MSKNNLLISFSGGETSAFMTHWLIKNKSEEYDFMVVFANTGQENEQTLDFVDKCDKHFGFNCVWVEAEVVHGGRTGTKHRVVDYKSASRLGEPFEEVIKKYGIPNQMYPHCTRELKEAPIHSYMKSLGYSKGDYLTAIGIRVDEIDRVNSNRKKLGLIYPLVDMKPMTRVDINKFWRDQPFRLELKGYQGNCKWCWKKSLRKHLTLINETPEYYDFPREIEKKYGDYIPPSRAQDTTTPINFFRGNLSTIDLFNLAKEDFEPAKDDSIIYKEYKQGSLFGYDLDSSNGCSESCEVFTA